MDRMRLEDSSLNHGEFVYVEMRKAGCSRECENKTRPQLATANSTHIGAELENRMNKLEWRL